VTYNPWATLFCVGSLVPTISESKLSVTLVGQREAPCGCPQQPIPGSATVNPDCFIPSDQNWDADAKHPHEFRLGESIWRADTGYELLKVRDNMVIHDVSQATRGTAGYAGTRAYLYSGAGLGERYGQWQIDVRLGNNFGSWDVFCEAFVLSGRDEFGYYVDGFHSKWIDGPNKNSYHFMPEIDVVETYWNCKGYWQYQDNW
jgi:hypothetical protein